MDLVQLLCLDLGWLYRLKMGDDAVDQWLHVCYSLVLLRGDGLASSFMKRLCHVVDEQVLLSHVLQEHRHQYAFCYIPGGDESHVATGAQQSQRIFFLTLTEQEGRWEKKRIHALNIARPTPGGGLDLAEQWVAV